MTNPFKKIAAVMGARGLLFSLLGLVLLGRAVPTLLSMDRVPDVAAALIGILLLTVGVFDLVRTAQQVTRLRKDKLDFSPIDQAYAAGPGGTRLPPTLMAADENPNEAGQANLVEWLARVFPRLAYVPRPYTAALHAAVIALAMGVLGVVILVLLRVLLAASTSAAQLSAILDWYLWLYFVSGFVFWAAVSRYGFRRALRFEGNLDGRKMVLIFLAVLAGAVVLAIGMSKADATPEPPPALGNLPTLLVLGSLLVIGATAAIVFIRGRRASDQYSVYRGEEFFTVPMHPTDLINVVKSYTGKLGAGTYMHLGSWKPEFAEHTAVSAGEFEADLNAESGISLVDNAPASPENAIGSGFAWLGLAMTAAAGFLLFQAASADWSSAPAMVEALRTPVGLGIFGVLFYRLGIIPVAELEWSSVIVQCLVNGTFQTQGGMALMHSGDRAIKGSVLTSATVQPRCAHIASVGFLQPGLAKQTVPRLIDRVEPAEQVGNELLAAIHRQAQQMTTIGTPAEPMKIAGPDEPAGTRETGAGNGADADAPPAD